MAYIAIGEDRTSTDDNHDSPTQNIALIDVLIRASPEFCCRWGWESAFVVFVFEYV